VTRAVRPLRVRAGGQLLARSGIRLNRSMAWQLHDHHDGVVLSEQHGLAEPGFEIYELTCSV
jgi:hypothetical protein